MDRYARTTREEIVSRPERVPTVAQGPAEKVLALQRGAGNRAVASMLSRRVIGNDPSTRVVRLTVGVELTTKLAQRAWELTAKGPIDEAGVETLRSIALEHWFGTIDDDERLFIAALLDPANAAKLHAAYPRDFSQEGSVIEFDAASITASNRRTVQDSGRSKRPQPDASDKANTKDPLDQDILAMGHPGFEYTVMQVLKFADQAHVDHVALYFAMLNGASDSTAGDRAFAGAVFVVARREGMAVDRDILGGRLKIDEVSTTFFDAMGDRAQAVYSPEAGGQLKGDTLYLPATFDLDNLADLGVLVHELQHASDDAAVDRPTSKSRLEAESAAYERQSRFLMLELEKLTGDARTKAAANVGSRIGQTHVYFMIAVALEATDDDQFDDRARIVAEVNKNKDPGTELEPAELRRALNDTKEGNRAKARAGIVDDIKRHKRPPNVIFRGFKGESAPDLTPAPAATLQRDPKDSKPSSFEQDISIDQIEFNVGGVNVSSGITLELLKEAQKRVSKGPLKSVEDLRDLRKIALADQTISDAERLFLAGLLDPENAKRVAAVDLKSTAGPSLKLRFVLDDETEKRIHAVEQFGRPAAGKGKPEAQIQALASGREKNAKALLQFAKERKVPAADVLAAMQTAASDFTVGDMVAAGGAYAVAAAASHPLAGDLKAGRIRVDEMPLADPEVAHYVPTASGKVWKGDTMYLRPSFDITSVFDRSSVIHELTHAGQDKARTKPEEVSKADLEPDAYIADARYVLEELANLKDAALATAVKQVAKTWGRNDLFAAVIASRADKARLQPMLKSVNGARPAKAMLENMYFDADESELRQHLLLEIHVSSSDRVEMTGLTGESVFDVKRTLARSPRILQRDENKGIHVHKGSKLSSAQFVNVLTSNRKVPRWLAKRLASANGSLVLSGKIDAPEDRIWLFVDAFADAINSGAWEITTAKSTIDVKEDADKKRTWIQLVVPDLQKGEHLGTWGKTGPGQEDLLRTSLFSDLPEVIYGWTSPDQATELTHEKRGFIVIVTEIEVTAPNGKKRVFRPSADNLAEAILHEISVHAGRITEGRPDVHDDRDAAVKDVVNEVGEFFKAAVAGSDELEKSPLSKEILKFVGEKP
ncbi:MAG: hypothetical protein ACXVUL_01415 [Solirubrobacteraceae bacterium]